MDEESLEPRIRKATVGDVAELHRLVNRMADRGEMLPRALSELYENVRDFHVVEVGPNVVGCCALHVCWEGLAEVRTLAVQEEYRKLGLGRALVDRCLDEADALGLTQVFTLTLRPIFFERIGFRRVDVSLLPRKVWGECFRCPKFPNCDEVALVKEHKQSAAVSSPSTAVAGAE